MATVVPNGSAPSHIDATEIGAAKLEISAAKVESGAVALGNGAGT